MNHNIDISFTRQVDPTALRRLYAQTTWASAWSDESIARMLANTRITAGAWASDRLIAFARVVTDDVFRAVIEDVVVDRPYRGQGIGSRLIHQLLARLGHVEEIALGCTPDLVGFYERFGFLPVHNCIMSRRGDGAA